MRLLPDANVSARAGDPDVAAGLSLTAYSRIEPSPLSVTA